MNKEELMELFKNQKYKEAIDGFSTLLEHDNKDVEIYNTLGLSYYYLNDFQNAEKYFVQALKINSTLSELYINLADVYYKQKLYAEAIDLLQIGIIENPENTVLKHYLARIYMEDFQHDLAIDELDAILEKEPDNYDAYYDLGRVYFELGNYDSAIECFENILEYKDDNAWIYYYLGEAYEANDEINKALSNFLKATAVNNKFAMPYKKAAILFMARGENEDAIEYFEDYINFGLPEEEEKRIKDIIKKLKG
jgi:tetratricopeptide (TPR) repeat protein